MDIENPAELTGYLRSRRLLDGAEEPMVEILAGGVSNKTVLVEPANQAAFVVKQALPKLRVSVDWFSDPERIMREALAMQTLFQLAPAGSITRLLFEDREQFLLGMEAVPKPHVNWKCSLLEGEVKLEHVREFGRLLASIHAGSYARRDELEPEFSDRTHFETLRLEPYYRYTAGQSENGRTRAFIGALIDDTLATRLTLVHGDYSPKNVLIREDHLVLLDHEVVHFGDPAFDIGFSLTHLLSKAHHLEKARDRFGRAAHEYWLAYADGLADAVWFAGVEERGVRHTLACLLARTRGRSPLEYLDAEELLRQAAVVEALMQNAPLRVPVLIDAFLEQIACR